VRGVFSCLPALCSFMAASSVHTARALVRRRVFARFPDFPVRPSSDEDGLGPVRMIGVLLPAEIACIALSPELPVPVRFFFFFFFLVKSKKEKIGLSRSFLTSFLPFF